MTARVRIKEDTVPASDLSNLQLRKQINEFIRQYRIAVERFEFVTATELRNDIKKLKGELSTR